MLQCRGLKGEAIVDDRVWIVKTHHPARTQKCLSFTASKIVVLVRNPLDVIFNYANQVNTMTHELKPEYAYGKDFPEWWNWWIGH